MTVPKAPFDIDAVPRQRCSRFAEQGHRTLFEQLVGCLLCHGIELNRLLVPFGKHACTPARPKCSACPVLLMCRQVGVSSAR